jgi:hypothetical protein
MRDFKKHIFLYDKQGKLVNFVEFDSDKQTVNCYNLSGRDMTKLNNYTYKEKNKVYKEIEKAQVTYAEDCTLRHMFFDGESLVRVVKLGSNSLESAKVLHRIYSHNNSTDYFPINPDLVRNWTEKL